MPAAFSKSDKWTSLQSLFLRSFHYETTASHDDHTVDYLEHSDKFCEVRTVISRPNRRDMTLNFLVYRLSTVLQILLFLPLTLATLSTNAFLLLSLLLFIHSLIHGTMLLFWRWPALSIMQVPMHPFLLLLTFNLFSQSVPSLLITAASWWGKFLSWSSPSFVAMEGLSSLLVAQKLGRIGRELAGEGETYQFSLLVASAAAYVGAAWRIGAVRSSYFFFRAPAFDVGVVLTGVCFFSPTLLWPRHRCRRHCWVQP